MNRKMQLLTALFIIGGSLSVFGQRSAVNRDGYKIHIVETKEVITIDGLLEEQAWITAEHTGRFTRVLPVDSGYAYAQTDALVSYDESNLYVAFICYDPTPGKRVVESLRRDFTFNKNDNCMVFLDTYNDQTNGFVFGVSPAGAQVDGLLYNTTLTAYTWNTKWRSAVKSYNDRWVAEFSIPLRNLRYNDGVNEWGINFGRVNLKTTEKSVWAPVPITMNSSSLQYGGSLIWDKPLKKTGLGFSFIPYVTGKIIQDNELQTNTRKSMNAGFDAKMILTTSMNLDLTVNPDYSQVEEDKQVANLDRFELFFPERRQFFLDNSDLFANLGSSGARPFFSRRIGLNVPVTGGGRLSGNIGDKWRIGLMDMQTGSKDEIPSSNFAVAVLQRQIFGRSNIAGFLINKNILSAYNDSLNSGSHYNRVAGLEYNLATHDNRWTGKAFYHQSFYPGATSDAASASGNIDFLTKSVKASFAQSWIGSDYVAEAGYIRRTGFFETSAGLKYSTYPGKGDILYHGPNMDFDIIFDPELRMSDRKTQLGYSFNWKSRSILAFNIAEDYVKLNTPFDPTNSGGLKLISGSDFNWMTASVDYSSDARKLFSFTAGGELGNYYNGTRKTFDGSVSYRMQPYGSVAITANYNKISLPLPFNSAEFVLIGTRLDLTFTDKLFLTTFVQYNDQIDNINMNVRFQWRYAPASDLFIVYTTNSYTRDIINKNRGLAIKVSYWFN